MHHKRRRLNSTDSQDDKNGKKEGELKYTTGKAKRNAIKQDFYMFQKKLVMKSELEKLREGFEADRKRLDKALRKDETKRTTRKSLI